MGKTNYQPGDLDPAGIESSDSKAAGLIGTAFALRSFLGWVFTEGTRMPKSYPPATLPGV